MGSSTRARTLTVFVSAVIAIGAATIGHELYRLPDAPHPLGWLALGALAILSASFALKVPGIPVYLSISDSFFITSALLFGPAPATLAIAADSVVMSWRRIDSPRQLVFNVTSSALSLWCGIQAYYALSGQPPFTHASSSMDLIPIVPLACLAAVYFLLNSGLTATAVALSQGVAALRLWPQHVAIIALSYFAAASASFFLIVLARYVGVSALAAFLPLICICYVAMRSWLGRVDDAQQHVTEINKLYLSTVSALSTAIEAKDGVTSEHIHRVQAYALALARELNVTDQPTVQAIEAAALLHDTGKLAIPEHILNKPGQLTASEFETMKAHVEVGADILSSIEFPYPVVPIVRAHHENWDGSGYPAGLRGEDIPIGARILSVVDCFDALTSDRPYRRAMSQVDALKVITERRGTMYDPNVVDTFVRVYRDIALPTRSQPQLLHALGRIRRAHRGGSPQLMPVHYSDATAGASAELLAFVSLARVAARTPTVSDIGALAWGHLRHLCPGATFALFTVDPTRHAVVSQYTAGAAALRLSALTIDLGHRVSGWSAANSRAVINSDAKLELGNDAPEDLHYASAVPLVADGKVIGVMTLYSPERCPDDRSRMLEMIAPHLASSVASAQAAAAPIVTDGENVRASRPDLRVVSRR